MAQHALVLYTRTQKYTVSHLRRHCRRHQACTLWSAGVRHIPWHAPPRGGPRPRPQPHRQRPHGAALTRARPVPRAARRAAPRLHALPACHLRPPRGTKEPVAGPRFRAARPAIVGPPAPQWGTSAVAGAGDAACAWRQRMRVRYAKPGYTKWCGTKRARWTCAPAVHVLTSTGAAPDCNVNADVHVRPTCAALRSNAA